MMPTGVPRGTEYWLLCSSCREVGFDLTVYELPFVVDLLNVVKQLETDELGPHEWSERQAKLLDELMALRAPNPLKLNDGKIIQVTLPAKERTKAQRRRLKNVGGYCNTRCGVCTGIVGMKPYEPGATVTCPECGNPVRMPTVPANA